MTERQEEQAALNALRALDAYEGQILRAEMRTHPQLRELAAELEEATAQLARLIPPMPPPEKARALILRTVRQRRRAQRSPWMSVIRFLFGPWVAWAAAIALALVLTRGEAGRRASADEAAEAVQSRDEARAAEARAHAETNVLKRGLTDATSRANQLKAELDALKEALKQADPFAPIEVFPLRSTSRRYDESSVAVIWNAARQEGRLRAEKLPPPPANRDYQLWVTDRKAGVAVSGGVVRLDARGSAVIRFKPASPVTGPVRFSLTVEAAGGAARKGTDSAAAFSGP